MVGGSGWPSLASKVAKKWPCHQAPVNRAWLIWALAEALVGVLVAAHGGGGIGELGGAAGGSVWLKNGRKSAKKSSKSRRSTGEEKSAG